MVESDENNSALAQAIKSKVNIVSDDMSIVKRSMSGVNSQVSSMYDKVVEINNDNNGSVLSSYYKHLLAIFESFL